MNKEEKLIVFLNISATIIGFAWIWLFIYNWKLALMIVLVMWSNNIFAEARKRRDKWTSN